MNKYTGNGRRFHFLQSNPLSPQRTLIRLSKRRAKQSSKALKGIEINLALAFFRARRPELFDGGFDFSIRKKLVGARSVD
jgi:hypothetical protein